MAKGLEYISSLVARSRMWEELYSRRYESSTAKQESSPLLHVEYKDGLEALYRQILKFQISSYRYYAKNGAFRLAQDLIKWDKWDELLEKVQEQEHAFSGVQESWRDMKYNEECSSAEKRHQDAIRCWAAIGEDTSGLLKAVQDAQMEKNRDGFLAWLCSIDPSEIYNTARRQHMNGTCDWLVRSSEESEPPSSERTGIRPSQVFETWKESPGSLLWLHGKGTPDCHTLLLAVF